MITTNDPELADRLRKLRQHAMDLSDLARHSAQDIVFESYPERGWNCRMTDMQAALGLCQLEVLDEILAERTPPGGALHRGARGASRTWSRPTSPTTRRARGSPTRSRVGAGVAGRAHRAHAPAARRRHRDAPRRDGDPPRGGYAGVDALLPHTEAAARDVLMLPLFPGLGGRAQDYVIDRLDGARGRPGRRLADASACT